MKNIIIFLLVVFCAVGVAAEEKKVVFQIDPAEWPGLVPEKPVEKPVRFQITGDFDLGIKPREEAQKPAEPQAPVEAVVEPAKKPVRFQITGNFDLGIQRQQTETQELVEEKFELLKPAEEEMKSVQTPVENSVSFVQTATKKKPASFTARVSVGFRKTDYQFGAGVAMKDFPEISLSEQCPEIEVSKIIEGMNALDDKSIAPHDMSEVVNVLKEALMKERSNIYPHLLGVIKREPNPLKQVLLEKVLLSLIRENIYQDTTAPNVYSFSYQPIDRLRALQSALISGKDVDVSNCYDISNLLVEINSHLGLPSASVSVANHKFAHIGTLVRYDDLSIRPFAFLDDDGSSYHGRTADEAVTAYQDANSSYNTIGYVIDSNGRIVGDRPMSDTSRYLAQEFGSYDFSAILGGERFFAEQAQFSFLASNESSIAGEFAYRGFKALVKNQNVDRKNIFSSSLSWQGGDRLKGGIKLSQAYIVSERFGGESGIYNLSPYLAYVGRYKLDETALTLGALIDLGYTTSNNFVGSPIEGQMSAKLGFRLSRMISGFEPYFQAIVAFKPNGDVAYMDSIRNYSSQFYRLGRLEPVYKIGVKDNRFDINYRLSQSNLNDIHELSFSLSKRSSFDLAVGKIVRLHDFGDLAEDFVSLKAEIHVFGKWSLEADARAGDREIVGPYSQVYLGVKKVF